MFESDCWATGKNERTSGRVRRENEAVRPRQGVRRSRTRHIDLQQFYASINLKTKLEVEPEKVTDPPSLLATRKAKDDYKRLVIREVLGQVEESIQALRYQAMLTREETIKREHAEQFREKAERKAEAATEQCLAERREHALTRERLEEFTVELESAREQNGRPGAEVMKLQAKTQDIPLADVMAALGYDGGAGLTVASPIVKWTAWSY